MKSQDHLSNSQNSNFQNPPKRLGKAEFKILGLSSLGGTLEFYDFIIFIFFAEYIAHVFFPPQIGEFWAMLNTYGAFAAGYFVRPLGGIVMAHFGDKFGRKNMFMLSILLMVIPTFLLAFIPGFEALGYLAPVLLLLVRVCQGIAIGGELPGAWVFIREHAPQNHKALYLSSLNCAMALGVLLGSVIALLINLSFSSEQIAEWAWRAPFFIGGIFGIIAVFLRRFLQETPVFVQMKATQSLSQFPLKDIFKKRGISKSIIPSMLITWVLTGCVMVLLLLMPKLMPEILKLSKINMIYAQMVGIFALALGSIAAGLLADRIGVFKACVIFSLCFCAFSLGFFHFLYASSVSIALVSYFVLCFFGGLNSFAPIIMAEIFSPNVRFSGISFSYNIAYAIAGGFTPQLVFFLNALALSGSFTQGIALYLCLLGFVAIVSVWLVRKRV